MSVDGTTHHLLPILFPAFLSFFFSASCAALVSKFGPSIALIDNPNGRSSHSLPTPRGGGIGIWIVFLIIGVFAILAYPNGLTLQIVVLVVFSIFFVISYNRVKKIKPKMALQ